MVQMCFFFVVESGDGANPNLYGTNIEKENLIGIQILYIKITN